MLEVYFHIPVLTHRQSCNTQNDPKVCANCLRAPAAPGSVCTLLSGWVVAVSTVQTAGIELNESPDH